MNVARRASRAGWCAALPQARLHPVQRRFVTPEGYLHKSRVPTMHYQKSLPRMPIPDLEKTLDRYLATLRPIASDSEYQEAERAVVDFRSGKGKALHQALVARDAAAPHTSYINQWWFEMYVNDRRPLPITTNPFLAFRDDENPEKMDQARRAADLLVASVRFKKTLEAGVLSPEVFHLKPKPGWFDSVARLIPSGMPMPFAGASLHSTIGFLAGAFPLDMSQFGNLFCSTRVPRRGTDEIKKSDPGLRQHVVVQRGAGFYRVYLTDESGKELPAAAIRAAMSKILNAEAVPEDSAIGILTTLPRDKWADLRADLEKIPAAKASLECIDSALCVLCLEDKSARGAEVGEVGYRELGTVMLHGNARNRWFDKSYQLIVCSNGKAAVNFEHAWGDGVAVLRYCNEVWKEAKEVTSDAAGDAEPCGVQLLPWDLTSEMKSAVVDAAKTFDAWLDRLQVSIAYVPEIDASVVKKCKVGADGLMQIAMQLAHYRLHGHLVASYESANHAAFKHGRTETIRPATMEALAFCQAMVDDAKSPETRSSLLRKAIKRHGSITKDALMGQGVDRLLFGLRKMADLEGGDAPAIFNTYAHQKWSKIIISTSTLDSPAMDGGGFGPINDDCYAIGYGMRKTDCGFIVSTYRDTGGKLADNLKSSLRDMVALLKEHPEAKE
eukprot:TRINITY_DN17713_c0_g1_i1.p1 TRINITY_DN17713_c0_g1~~TRINITY_DN17713_c0_g1_i1.p1  ORF type:complete len:668 (+),score=215.07 TRINITY_DN17713_c0_g1_i1:70-2073(+)